jgi:hypothetical protein
MLCNSNIRKGVLFAVMSLLFFTACKQQPNDNPLSDGDDNGGYASDLSRIEWATDDIISIADAAGTFYFMGNRFLADCASIATDTMANPHTLVVRFGDNDCICKDGRKRRGSIIIKYNGHYSDTSMVHTITFTDYFVNGNQVTGDIQLVRVDTTITNNSYYKVVVNDSMNISQKPLNSQMVAWRGNLVRRWVTGFETGDRGDDVFSISGNATLTRANGHAYGASISAPLQVALGCDYVRAGVVNITGYKGGRRLDYGSGDCDPSAKLFIGVNSYDLVLTR